MKAQLESMTIMTLVGLASIAMANTPLPCVPNGHAAAPIFDRPNIDLEAVGAQGGLIGATWENGTGEPSGVSIAKDPLIPIIKNESPVDVFLLDGVGPSVFMSLQNNSGVFSSSDYNGKWHEVDDYDVDPTVDGCIHLKVCWTVHAYKVYTPPAKIGKIGIGSKGIEIGTEFPIGTPNPRVIDVSLSFCEQQELCPC